MRLTVIILSMLWVPVLCAQEPIEGKVISSSDTEVLPGVRVEPVEYDFGDIYFGKSVEHGFTIVNTGETPFSIANIRSDCGCSVDIDTDTPIAPGSRRVLTVHYQPEYRTGNVRKRITVYTDMKSEKAPSKWFEVFLKATIRSVVSLDPGHVYFKKVHMGETAEERVEITAAGDTSVDMVSAESRSEYLDVKLEKTANSEDAPRSWLLILTLKDTAPAGRFSDQVLLTTNSDLQKEIPIDVLGFIRSNVSVRPTQCYLGTLTPGESVEETFTVRKTGETTDLAPPEIKNAPEFMTYEVKTVTDQKEYSILATFTVPSDHSGRLSGSFTVVTGQASLPEFEVPVFGYVLPPDVKQSIESE